jgi:hypothetical protein
MKTFKHIIIAINILAFIIFFIYTHYQEADSREKFLQESYSGIVENSVVDEFGRGSISIKLKDQWINLGFHEPYIQEKIKIGDSIVKESGTSELKVYRIIDGEWKKIKLKHESKYNYPND